MNNELVAGALAVVVRAKRDTLNEDLRKAEEDVKKERKGLNEITRT
ncbi:MAG: hypothetical protein IPK06_04370 [Ignavibacteriae bacterium]|nr:hypothetical protein [Ignavibacteriota bacterium]